MNRFIFFLFLASLVSIKSYSQDTIYNHSVVEMVNIGLSDEIVLTKISTSFCKFDVSIDALKKLKENGVSNDIIIKMMETNNGKTKDSFIEIQTDDNFTESEHMSPGIYFYDLESNLKPIYPSTFTGNKTNTLATAFTYGLASTSVKSTMNGSSSKNVVNTVYPQFRLVFSDISSSDAPLYWMFAASNSPNQFSLVELDKKKNSRELKTGSVNIISGTSFGIDEKSIIDFEVNPINKTDFTIRPTKFLHPGEYCFVYNGITPYGGTNVSVFDFTIPEDAFTPAKFSLGSKVYVRIEDKIRKCKILDIYIKDNQYIYIGEDNYMNILQWSEPNCSLNKNELK